MLHVNHSLASDSINNMNLEKKVDQLTEILTDLVPSVDALVLSQQKTDRSINLLIKSQLRTNLAIAELRQSNIRMADAIEKLTHKIDKVDGFEVRLKKVEDRVFAS